MQEKLRVLLVDDDPDILGMLETIATAAGTHVTKASDAMAAFGRLVSQRFDLVITDVQMPGVQGTELVRWIRASTLNNRCRIAVITGAKMDEVRAALKQHADVTTMAKPFDPKAVLQLINDTPRRPGRASTLAQYPQSLFDTLGAAVLGFIDAEVPGHRASAALVATTDTTTLLPAAAIVGHGPRSCGELHVLPNMAFCTEMLKRAPALADVEQLATSLVQRIAAAIFTEATLGQAFAYYPDDHNPVALTGAPLASVEFLSPRSTRLRVELGLWTYR
jgi:CheY-like chemotaxis protein